MEQVVEAIVKWLRKQVEHARVNGLVVGVSGGLDSAVVAHLIKRAFPNDSIGVIMPLKSNHADMMHANLVVQSCDLKSITVDLTEAHEILYCEIKEQLKEDFNEKNDRMEDANLRARLRMSTLYTIATNYNYLVVGTDNAAEWFTGYFTKYGDGGVDLLPLTEFTKGEVREMAIYLGVPDEVVYKKPSADLWEGQTDEAEMGTTYDKIDAFLRGDKIPEADQRIIEKLHQKTEHKRNLAPHFSRRP